MPSFTFACLITSCYRAIELLTFEILQGIKPEGFTGRKCALADCTVKVVNQWGLLRRLRVHYKLTV